MTELLEETRERVPFPDPTRMTTQQITREIANLREIVFTRIDGMDRALTLANESIHRQPNDAEKIVEQLRVLVSTRIDGIDHQLRSRATEATDLVGHLRDLIGARLDSYDAAIKLLQNINDRLPTLVDEKIDSLRLIQEEKFSSIQTQFKERDVRTEQSSKDSKVAVDAALQAAKEAVGEQNKSSALAIQKSENSTVKQIDQLGLLIATQSQAVDDKFSDVKDRLTRIEGREVGKINADTNQHTNYAFIVSLVVAAVGVAALLLSLFHGKG